MLASRCWSFPIKHSQYYSRNWDLVHLYRGYVHFKYLNTPLCILSSTKNRVNWVNLTIIYQTAHLLSSDQLLLMGIENIHKKSLLQLTHQISESWDVIQVAYNIQAKNHNKWKREFFNSLDYLLHLFYLSLLAIIGVIWRNE